METPVDRFFHCADVALNCAQHLEWNHLRSLRSVSRATRHVVADEIRRRFSNLCYKFLPTATFQDFKTLMKNTQSGVVGEVPHRLMNIHLAPPKHLTVVAELQFRRFMLRPSTFELHLVIPPIGVLQVEEWFRVRDFSQPQEGGIPLSLREHVSRTFTVSHARPKFAKGSLESQTLVRVSVTKTNIVDTALSSPWSHYTSIITSNTLVSFFPRQYLAQDALYSDARRSRSMVVPRSHWITMAKQLLKIRPCGSSCPGLPVNQPPSTRPEIVVWSEDRLRPLFRAEVEDTVLQLRFFQRCRNKRCIQYSAMV